jgi:hypothetical protein
VTSEEIALQILKPIFEEMRELRREQAVSGALDEQGDAERRKAAHAVLLIDEIQNQIEARIGINYDD